MHVVERERMVERKERGEGEIGDEEREGVGQRNFTGVVIYV